MRDNLVMHGVGMVSEDLGDPTHWTHYIGEEVAERISSYMVPDLDRIRGMKEYPPS